MTSGEGLTNWIKRKVGWLRKKLTPREEALAKIADILDIADDDEVTWLVRYIRSGGIFAVMWDNSVPFVLTARSWWEAAVERTKRNKELWRVLRLARDVELQNLVLLLGAKITYKSED